VKKRGQTEARPLQSVGEIQAPDLRNRTIAVSLQQFHYLTTKGVVIDQKAADIE
jgi:hypothetical protein